MSDMSAAATLPSIGVLLELHDVGPSEGSGRSSLARVEEASAGRVVVALPADAAVAPVGIVGSSFELVWPGRDGVMVHAATLTERHGGSQLELWEFATTGAARVEQRRHEPRVPARGDVAITADEGLAASLSGSLVDLSAGALRCMVDVGADDAVLSSGAHVRCDFALAGTAVSVGGVVHAAWTQDAPPCVRVVVQFDPGQPGLDVISQHVAATDARLHGRAAL